MVPIQIIAAKPPGLSEKILCCYAIGLFGLIGLGLLYAAIRELRLDGSEIIRQPSWQDGQKTEVFFDPAGEMKPCLATGWSLWFMGIGMLAAGLMFFGASVMMCFLFLPKAFA
jgi:hypothetical protein